MHDADSLAFEFCGSGVKAMTEEDHVAAGGNIQHSGKAGPIAQRWADKMTEKYPELAVADPIFGQLQNCMELAVVGALIVKDRLAQRAGNSFPTLLDTAAVQTDTFNAPKQTESVASVLKKGHNWLITTSGGVSIPSWQIADKARQSDAVAPVREKAAPTESTNWWWN